MPKTFDDYSADLEDLVAKAQEAILDQDDTRLKQAHKALADFIAASDDRVDGVTELDEVAANTMRDITLARLDATLVKNLAERSADLARLIKTITNQSATNRSAAAALRLQHLQSLLQASTTVINELNKFQDLVDTTQPDGKKLVRVITIAVAAVTSVQQQVTA